MARWSIFVDANPRSIEPAVAFEADQAGVAQIVTSSQECGGGIGSVSHHDHPPIAQQGSQRSQLLDSHFDGRLVGRNTSAIQGRDPATWGLGQEDHMGVLPADTEGFVHQGQVRQMDVAPILARLCISAFNGGGIHRHPDRFVLRHEGEQGLHHHLSHPFHIDLSVRESLIHTGPFPFKDSRQRQFDQRLRLAFTEQSITHIKHGVGSSLHAAIDLLAKLLQGDKLLFTNGGSCGIVHLSKAPGFFLLYSSKPFFATRKGLFPRVSERSYISTIR